MMAKKRVLSWLVAASLALSLLPTAVLAVDETESTTPKDAFDQVVDKIDDTFIKPDQNDANNLNEGVENVKADEVAEQVDNANNAANGLETGLKETTEKVEVPKFEVETITDEDGNEKTEVVQKGEAEVVEDKDLDAFMKDKADAVGEAADNGDTLVGEANDLIQDLNDLVQAGEVETLQGIADEVAKKAEAANAEYEKAAVAHAEAEYALNAAKEKYNAVIYNAVKDTYTQEAFNALTDKEKAALADSVIGEANADLGAARTALETAKDNLTALKVTYEAAETAKVIAEKYQTIAKAMEGKTLSAQEFIAILLNKDMKDVAEDQILGKLDKTNFDNGGLTDTAVDYALADENLQAKKEELNTFNESDEAKKAQDTIKEINNQIEEAQKVIDNLRNAKLLPHLDKSEFDSQLTLMSNCLTDLQNAREVLQNPTKTAAEKQAAQQKQSDAMKILFVDDGKGHALVDRFYTGTQWDGGSSHRWDYAGTLLDKDHKAAVANADRLCELLMGKTVKDHSGSVWVKEQEVQQSGYDGTLSDKLKGVNDAQNAFDAIDLDKALTDYLNSVSTDEKAAEGAADKAAQLAAVLRAISEEAVEKAQKKAAEAAEAAQKAADDLDKAQDAYDKALEKLNKTVRENLDGDTLKNLLKNAEAQLARAKEALDTAKDNKDKADEIKKNADQAVEDAQERRDELNNEIENIITGGDTTPDTADDDDTAATIEDGIVPLALMPTRGELMNYLYVRAGSPAAQAPTFTDVPADHEFAAAIGWAQANGIAVAYEDGTFDPDNFVIAADLTAFLTRYADFAGMTMPALTAMAGLEDDAIVENADEILAEFFGG